MVKRFSQKDEKIILVFLSVFNMPLSAASFSHVLKFPQSIYIPLRDLLY